MKKHILLPLILLVSSLNVLQATSDIDSLLSLIPLNSLENLEITSMFDKLPNGKLPSDYHFAIKEPTEEQVQAWLDGDYDFLASVLSVDDPVEQDKASFLENAQESIGKARAVIAEVRKAGAFIQTLTGGDLVTLPVGISDTLGQTQVTVGIGHMLLFPTYASIEVYVEVYHPGKMASPIFFGSPDIKFSREGGLSGDFSLGLLGNVRDSILNEKAILTWKGAQVDEATNEFKTNVGTFASFSCTGIDAIGIDVNVELDTSVAIPIDTAINRVAADFQMSLANGFDDLMINLDFNSPFHHPRKAEVVFEIDDVVFDFSETTNSDAINFPELTEQTGYNPLATLPEPNNWEGFYVGQIGVTWRDSIVNQTDTTMATSLQVQGRQIVIDKNGFTGFLMATPILDIDQGSLGGGWAISIDTLEVQITTNQFAGLYFNGALSIPIFEKNEEETAEGGASNNNEEGEDEEVESNMRYIADFDFFDNYYSFTASFDSTKVLPMDMLHAQVTLYNTSTFTIAYGEDEGFELRADLTGQFGASDAETESGKTWDIPTIGFEHLVVSNQAPFLESGGTWDLPDSLNIGYNGYGLTLSHLEFSPGPDDDEAQLKFVAMINLAAADNCEISAGGGFRIIGKIEELPDDRQKWRFDRLKVDMIEVEYDTEGLYLYGQVIFFEEHQFEEGEVNYGDGFQGTFRMQLGGLTNENGGGIEISAMGIFGTVSTAEGEGDNGGDNYKYWLVDALLASGAGIPMGTIALHGIGGGAYWRMSQADLANGVEETNTTNQPEGDPTEGADNSSYEAYVFGNLGKSLSGAVYEPNQGVNLGVNATVVLATYPASDAFNTTINFNIEWNDTGGLNHIKLGGTANFNAPITWGGPACTGTSLAINMEYIFEGSTSANGQREGFYASAHAFVETDLIYGGLSSAAIPTQFVEHFELNCTGGIESVKYAGGMELQISPETSEGAEDGFWYLNIGTPDQRITLSADLLGEGDDAALSIDISAYLDVGKNIPDFPGLPDNVAELTQLGGLNRDGDSLEAGTGFAFGVAADISTGGDFWIFRAFLEVGAGFDLMFLKYDPVPTCLNNDNEPLGFKSWYAMGQAWAFIEGGMQVQVTENSYYDIFYLSLATAIQMKAPNPTYGRGAVAGSYSILGGLINGNCHFQFEFGEECLIAGGGELEVSLPLIASTIPSNGEMGSGVDTRPMVEFEFPLNEPFFVNDIETNIPVEYYYEIDLLELRDSLQNVVEGEWTSLGPNAKIFTPNDMLLGNAEYDIIVKATPYRANDGNALASDEKVHTFKTGYELPTIPLANVKEAYPGPGHFSYYPMQGFNNGDATGIIKLSQGQDALLTSPPEGHLAKVKITTTCPNFSQYTSFTYDEEENTLSYTIIPTVYKNGFSYRLDVVHITEEYWAEITNSGGEGGSGGETEEGQEQGFISPMPSSILSISALGLNHISSNTTEFFYESSINTINPVHDNDTEFLELTDEETPLLSFFFRVSKYDTFEDKIAGMAMANLQAEEDTDLNIFGESMTSPVQASNVSGLEEPFGLEELVGINGSQPMIRLEADLDNTNWMNNVTSFVTDDNIGATPVDLYAEDSDCNFLQYLDYNLPGGRKRSELGESVPDKALSLLYENMEAYQVDADKAKAWNIMARDGDIVPTDIPVASPSLLYYVHNVVQDDVSKFKWGTYFSSDGYGYGQYPPFLVPLECTPENSADMTVDCQTALNGYDEYDTNPYVLFDLWPCCQIDEYAECVQQQYASALSNNPCLSLFFKTFPGNCHAITAREYSLDFESGTYPIKLKFVLPSGSEVYNESYNLIKN